MPRSKPSLVDLRILASHPVQYQVPFFRELIRSGLKIEVGYYQPDAAERAFHDAEFRLDIE